MMNAANRKKQKILINKSRGNETFNRNVLPISLHHVI